ncbi:MATE family efflux transporter [Syntrophobacter fumaroxidans]|nr:MATE family efflux transporter [Syntrophobacter fumaroxidans]
MGKFAVFRDVERQQYGGEGFLMERQTDGTSKGLTGIIWRNSWPVLGLMLLNFVVGYTDIYVAGLLGPDVQAAVGFISQQYFVLIVLANALAIGTVAVVSKAAGRNDWAGVLDLTRQSLILCVLSGLLLTLLGFSVGPYAVLRLFSLPETVQPLALVYVKIYAAALFPNYVIIVAGAVFRAVGKPVIAFRIMFVVAALNILANFGLVFGLGPLPRLGYAGIAVATAVSMSAGACGILAVLLRHEWKPMWSDTWRLSREVLRELGRIGWPAVVVQIAWNAASLVIYQFLGYLGDWSVPAMAAYANGLRIESLTFLPAFALNMAAAVLVGQSLGAHSVEQARRFGWRIAGMGVLSLSAIAAVLYAAAPWIAHRLTSNPDVLFETIRYLRINLVVAPAMVLGIVLGGGMQGAGYTRGVMAVVVIATWLIRIPLAAFLSFTLDLGALGIWLAMSTSIVVQAVMMTWTFHRGYWHKTISSSDA